MSNKAVIATAPLARQDSKPLITSLKSACNAFERESLGAGVNKLQSFQNKVQSQIGTSYPALADDLITMAQDIIVAVNGP